MQTETRVEVPVRHLTRLRRTCWRSVLAFAPLARRLDELVAEVLPGERLPQDALARLHAASGPIERATAEEHLIALLLELDDDDLALDHVVAELTALEDDEHEHDLRAIACLTAIRGLHCALSMMKTGRLDITVARR